MVTIRQNRSDNTTNNLVILDTTEAAEAFLDRLAGSYWGLPGMKAKRGPGSLTVEVRAIGAAGWTTLSTYKIEAA